MSKIIRKSLNTNYVMIRMPDHPRSNNGYIYEHILLAEMMTGGPLPEGSVVHHKDGNGENNELNNLTVFKSNADHLKYHAKIRKGAK